MVNQVERRSSLCWWSISQDFTVGAYFDSQRLASSARPPRPRLRRGAVAAEAAAEAAAATIVDFREVTVQYATNKAPPDLGLDESVSSAVG